MALKDYPMSLRPFIFHGITLKWQAGDEEATAICFLCGKINHLHINSATGVWNCKRCLESGNIYTFLQKLYDHSQEWGGYNEPDNPDYEKAPIPPDSTTALLSTQKNISPQTMKEWGIVDSCITADPLIPGYNTDGKLATLYRVVVKGDKWQTLVTPNTKRHPFGWNLYAGQKEVYLCEGPWDAMTLYEQFKGHRKLKTGKLTKSVQGTTSRSLLNHVSILGLTGAGHWTDELYQALPTKITVAFDNDHPQRRGSHIVQPGWDGVQRMAQLVTKQRTTFPDVEPKKLYALNWGKTIEHQDNPDIKDTYNHNPDLPSGYDISDLFTDYEPVVGIEQILAMRELVKLDTPAKKSSRKSKKQAKEEEPVLEPLPRTSFKELCKDYHDHLHFPQRLEDTLAVMLAAIVSVRLEGIQIWLRIIGPPGSGKTTLAEALSADRDNVFPISHFTGLHSGYVEPGSSSDSEDNSLIVKMHNRTTIVKDGDTLLSNSARNAILSEFRDVFDGSSRAHYRNKVTHEYEDIRTSLIICGTDELRVLNRSALGERFLDFDILGSNNGESYVDRALRNTMSQVTRGFAASDSSLEKVPESDLKCLERASMGYIHHLVTNLKETQPPRSSDKVSQRIKALASFVSLVRTKNKGDREDPTHRIRPELPTRISAQFKKLAICITYVLNKPAVDKQVMTILKSLALDTADGYQLEIVHSLYKRPVNGLTTADLSDKLRLSQTLIRRCLENMHQIGMVEMETNNNSNRRGRKTYQWSLTDSFRNLYKLALK